MFGNFLFIGKAFSSRKHGRGKKRKNMPGYTLAVNAIGRHYWKPTKTIKAVYKKAAYIADKAQVGDVIKRQAKNVTVLGTLGNRLVTYDPITTKVRVDDLKGERNVVLRSQVKSLLKQRPELLKKTLFNGRLTVADVVRISKFPRKQLRQADRLIDIKNWKHVGANQHKGVQQSHWIKDPETDALYLAKENERPANFMEVVAPSAVLERFASRLGDIVGVPVNTVSLGEGHSFINGVVSLHQALRGTEGGRAKELGKLMAYDDDGELVANPELVKHETSPDMARIMVLDSFLLNVDRHYGNLMVDEDGKLFAIDNSFAVTPARERKFYETRGLDYPGTEGSLKAIIERRPLGLEFEGGARSRLLTEEQRTAALEIWDRFARLTNRQLEDLFREMPDEAFVTPKILGWMKSISDYEYFNRDEIANHFKQRRDEFKEAYEKLIKNA